MPKARILVNQRPPDQFLSITDLYNRVLPEISSDSVLSKDFEEVLAERAAVDAEVKNKDCPGCELGKHAPMLTALFIKCLKSAPRERQAAVINKLGKKAWVTHAGHWVNLVTNEMELLRFEEREFPDMLPAQRPAVPVAGSVQQKVPDGQPRRVIITNFQSPGDIVMLTAAVRDLHRNHPGKFLTDVRTNSMSIWEGNHYITKLDERQPGVEAYRAEYPLIHHSNQGPYHFTESFTDWMEDALGVRIKDRLCRGHIEMRPEEEAWGRTERTAWFGEYGYGPDTEYWIVNAGHKNDFTAKMWSAKRHQEVVDHFRGRILFVQVGHPSHNHPKLEGVVNLARMCGDKPCTDDRQLIRLVWASSGVLTPCSYAMVLAAAVPVKKGTCNGRSERPCVVVAGGREPAGWQAYNAHQFIHTCGMLPCCSHGGCWISRVKPIGDGDEKDKKNLCHHVVTTPEGEEMPFCMDMITSEEVIRRIEMFYKFYSPGRPKTHSYNER